MYPKPNVLLRGCRGSCECEPGASACRMPSVLSVCPRIAEFRLFGCLSGHVLAMLQARPRQQRCVLVVRHAAHNAGMRKGFHHQIPSGETAGGAATMSQRRLICIHEPWNTPNISLYSSVVERQSCKLKVLGSNPSGGWLIASQTARLGKCLSRHGQWTV